MSKWQDFKNNWRSKKAEEDTRERATDAEANARQARRADDETTAVTEEEEVRALNEAISRAHGQLADSVQRLREAGEDPEVVAAFEQACTTRMVPGPDGTTRPTSFMGVAWEQIEAHVLDAVRADVARKRAAAQPGTREQRVELIRAATGRASAHGRQGDPVAELDQIARERGDIDPVLLEHLRHVLATNPKVLASYPNSGRTRRGDG
ncbi:hypothetical protein [Kitasatospora kifunensis]|uniref:Uncharacterized protein n=1 Tax=Kitasatospora kifunensis TaxID=58351 RepID=A0A7W7R9G2_KITKI|nr:hypothetical protein [Kitasatospora kifunensis]MBB4927680.1 hypothetical protein [Kitasatospora kifunensis]